VQKWFKIGKSLHVIHYINQRKDKNHTIFSKELVKAFNKIQHPFVLKTLMKLEMEGMYLNIIKATYASLKPISQ
jgi:hypothetical protein